MTMFRKAVLASALLGVALVSFQSTPAVAQAGKVCKLEITGNDLIQYDKKELKVAGDCATVELTLKHVGKLPVQSMGHNWVLTKTADAGAVANAGMAAGLKADHVPPNDKRVIAYTKLVGGGQSTKVSFATSKLQKGGDYTYFCSFPGHSAIMRGKLIFG